MAASAARKVPMPDHQRSAAAHFNHPRACMTSLAGLTRKAALALAAVLLAACASAPSADGPRAHFPLLRGWADGQEVTYVTTDISDATVAKAKNANFVPALANALPARSGQRSMVDKVYAVTNFTQGSVFASAPAPLGHLNRDTAYSPLWQMVMVSWRAGQPPHTLKSQEQILDAAEKGLVLLETTSVVLNCPIIHHATQGGLAGVTMDRATP